MCCLLKWYVELYPKYIPHYRPFGIDYEIYNWVSILYTTRGDTLPLSFKGHDTHQWTTLMQIKLNEQ